MIHPVIKSLFEELHSSLNAGPGESLFADGRPVLIYGAGNIGKDVFRLLTSRGVVVAGFLDRQAKPDSAWMGVPILLPNDPAITGLQRERTHVVMGLFNTYVDMPPIFAMLKSLGYGRVTSFLDLHDHFAEELGDRFWLTSRSYYRSLEEQVSEGYELWADDSSRKLYVDVLRFRFSKDHNALVAPDEEVPYFAKDLPPWPTPLRLVDCGAFDGDTLRQLSATGLPVEAIAAFEPDPANFVKLAQHMRASQAKIPETVSLFPCGVHASTCQLRFASGQGTGSHASSDGDTIIQCVSLDEALPVFRPNLIKMDIEGAEYAALWGARQMVAEHRPGLALCLYHRPEHLWQIPLLAKQLTGGGGRSYLRAYSYNAFEVVYYWIP